MKSSNPIWCIVPYRNNHEQTLQTALDLLAQTVDTRILLIANGGAALELPALADATRIYTWQYDPALSLAAVWNRALDMVWSTGELAWVCNNDIRLHRNTLRWLIDGLMVCDAWFVSASNVRERWEEVQREMESDQWSIPSNMRGGPDFSCFLIHRECHRWFQFDEQFYPAYHEDNDYHRRLQLAGFGEKIFSLNIPYYHLGSGTLRANPEMQSTWGLQFARSQQHYVDKWGGLPGAETLQCPYREAGPSMDARYFMLGQGGVPANELVQAAEQELFHADRG